MKAPTLLEAIKRAMNKARYKNLPQMGKRSDYSDFAGEIYALHDFYSMPFTPELLVGDGAIFANFSEIEEASNQAKFHTNLLLGDWETGWIFGISHHNDGINQSRLTLSGPKQRFSHPIWPKNICKFIDLLEDYKIPLTFTEYGKRLFTGAQEIPNALNEDPNRSDDG